MSNILVIKHGSLGDVVQISGALRDIRNAHSKDKITILTSTIYRDIFKQCPFVDDVIVDRRKSFLDIVYLAELRKDVKKYEFKKVYDLQNSSRTELYRKYIFRIKDWCSTRTILNPEETKREFDKEGVIERFETQLNRGGVNTNFTRKPDFSWAVDESFQIDTRIRQEYVYIAPFTSVRGDRKKWPYFAELIKRLKEDSPDLDVVVTPGPSEIEEAKDIGAILQLDGDKATNIRQMAKVIQNAKFVISNDTGPAHIAAHLGCKGLALFGPHTTPKKTSIETDDFKTIEVADLKDLSVDDVYKEFKVATKDYEIV